jgi:hypothetical protein
MNLYYIFHIPKDIKRGEHVKQDAKTKVHAVRMKSKTKNSYYCALLSKVNCQEDAGQREIELPYLSIP